MVDKKKLKALRLEIAKVRDDFAKSETDVIAAITKNVMAVDDLNDKTAATLGSMAKIKAMARFALNHGDPILFEEIAAALVETARAEWITILTKDTIKSNRSEWLRRVVGAVLRSKHPEWLYEIAVVILSTNKVKCISHCVAVVADFGKLEHINQVTLAVINSAHPDRISTVVRETLASEHPELISNVVETLMSSSRPEWIVDVIHAAMQSKQPMMTADIAKAVLSTEKPGFIAEVVKTVLQSHSKKQISNVLNAVGGCDYPECISDIVKRIIESNNPELLRDIAKGTTNAGQLFEMARVITESTSPQYISFIYVALKKEISNPVSDNFFFFVLLYIAMQEVAVNKNAKHIRAINKWLASEFTDSRQRFDKTIREVLKQMSFKQLATIFHELA